MSCTASAFSVTVTVSVALAAVSIPLPPAISNVFASDIVWSEPVSADTVKLFILPTPVPDKKAALVCFFKPLAVSSYISITSLLSAVASVVCPVITVASTAISLPDIVKPFPPSSGVPNTVIFPPIPECDEQ